MRSEFWRGGVILHFRHKGCRYRIGAWKEGSVVEIIPGEEAVKALTVDVIPK